VTASKIDRPRRSPRGAGRPAQPRPHGVSPSTSELWMPRHGLWEQSGGDPSRRRAGRRGGQGNRHRGPSPRICRQRLDRNHRAGNRIRNRPGSHSVRTCALGRAPCGRRACGPRRPAQHGHAEHGAAREQSYPKGTPLPSRRCLWPPADAVRVADGSLRNSYDLRHEGTPAIGGERLESTGKVSHIREARLWGLLQALSQHLRQPPRNPAALAGGGVLLEHHARDALEVGTREGSMARHELVQDGAKCPYVRAGVHSSAEHDLLGCHVPRRAEPGVHLGRKVVGTLVPSPLRLRDSEVEHFDRRGRVWSLRQK
jgi:hypothetical protein